MSDIKKETEATEETVEIPVTDGSEEETAAEAEDTEKESFQRRRGKRSSRG